MTLTFANYCTTSSYKLYIHSGNQEIQLGNLRLLSEILIKAKFRGSRNFLIWDTANSSRIIHLSEILATIVVFHLVGQNKLAYQKKAFQIAWKILESMCVVENKFSDC